MEQLMKTGEASFEVSPFRKDGSTVPLSVQARIGNWGGTNVVLSIASDITESKETKNVEEKNRNKIPGIL
jgi:PAS domain S-box-containing protein